MPLKLNNTASEDASYTWTVTQITEVNIPEQVTIDVAETPPSSFIYQCSNMKIGTCEYEAQAVIVS